MLTISKFKITGAVVGSVALVGAAGLAAVPEKSAEAQQLTVIEEQVNVPATDLRTASAVKGTFAFSQDVISSSEQIAKAFRKGVATGCFHFPDYKASELSRSIAVGGSAAEKNFVATVDDMADKDDAQTYVMGCACSGNAAGGNAIVNAEVSGVRIVSIAAQAGVQVDGSTD